MPAPISATTPRACPCTASDAGRTCLNRTEGCPHRNYWRCVQSMKKNLNDLTLKYKNCTPLVYLLPPTSGFSKPDLHPSERLMNTASHGAIEAAASSFQSFTMENQPVSGLVEQSMDGSLSTSCREGQLALTGMDYAEIERRVLSWRMSCLQSGYTKRDIAAWLYSGQLSPSGRVTFGVDEGSSGGSIMMEVEERDGSLYVKRAAHWE
jgi:hypothetical protein